MKVGDLIETIPDYAGGPPGHYKAQGIVHHVCVKHVVFNYLPREKHKKRVRCEDCKKYFFADGFDLISSWKVLWNLKKAIRIITSGI